MILTLLVVKECLQEMFVLILFVLPGSVDDLFTNPITFVLFVVVQPGSLQRQNIVYFVPYGILHTNKLYTCYASAEDERCAGIVVSQSRFRAQKQYSRSFQ